MTDSAMLRDLIRSRGIKYQYIAKCLGISAGTLKRKIENQSGFRTREVTALCLAVGGLSAKDQMKILGSSNLVGGFDIPPMLIFSR